MACCGRAAQFGLAAATLICLVSFVHSCFIAGYDSGKCADPSDFDDQMSFCGEFIKYRACIPLANVGGTMLLRTCLTYAFHVSFMRRHERYFVSFFFF